MNDKDINNVLDSYFWPETLDTCRIYSTTHDDHGGKPESGILCVQFSQDGDAWINIKSDRSTNGLLRFRMPMQGGGKYPKIRNALLILAEAIRQEGSYE